MINRCLISLCLLACNGLFTAALAQVIPHLTGKLTVEEGLSSNTINDILQDDNGFLWIATPEGLNRFDGTDVLQFYHHTDTNSLPHNYIYCLKQLPGHYLAIGTQAGLSFYDGNTGNFQNYYYRQNNTLDPYNNTIIGLETDRYGNLWAASKNCVFVFDKQRKIQKIIPSSSTEATAIRQRLSFAEKIWPLSNGDVLLCLFDGWKLWSHEKNTLIDAQNSPFLQQLPVCDFPYAHIFPIFGKNFLRLPPGKDSLELVDEKGRQQSNCYFPYNKYPYISWSQQVVAVDSTSILFLFHNYGLAILPVRWDHDTPALLPLSPLLFPSDEYQTAISDRQGNWWLATTREGLQKYSPAPPCFTATTLLDPHTHTPARYETSSCSRFGRTLWTATYGSGFFGTDLATGRQIHHRLHPTGNNIWADFIWNIRQINTDTCWIGTQNGLFWYSLSSKKNGRLPNYPGKPPALDSVAITTQFTDSRGKVWLGLGKGNGVCCYDTARRSFTNYPGNTAQGYPLRYPTNIAEDSDGKLWFANDASNQLVRWDPTDGRFRTISLPSPTLRQIGNIVGIHIEGDSVLWLGSITCGLVKFIPRTNLVTVYGHEKGLNNSRITSIYEDPKRRLWLVTEGGLACFDQRTETFINYSTRNGLPVTFPTASFFYDATDRRLYTGGHGNYFYFDPAAIDPGQAPQKTLITAMQVNGQPWRCDPARPALLRAQQNDITIRYAAVDLNNGPSITYAYQLTGIDTGWVMAGRQRQINFSHLAPGNYTFRVRAQSNGIWSPEAAGVSFRIQPPFTQTAWFYALLLLAIVAATWSFFLYRARQANNTREVRSEISRNLHDEVGANLTNISFSSLLAQRQLNNGRAVNQLLERIYQDSLLVSESMREIVWSINPDIDTLGDALPRMLHYAAQLLESNSIELNAAVAPEVEQLKLSMKQRRDLYLIFKEAVNNMVRHSNASRAFIHFELSGPTLIMRIADNGSGFDTVPSSWQNGLKNMQQRAGEHKWNLEIRSRPTQGASITLNARIA